jgi:hypothetical protein
VKLKIFLIFALSSGLPALAASKSACKPETFTPCSRSHDTVPLEELTFNRLDKDLSTYRNLRSKYLKAAFKKKRKPKNLSRCFDTNYAKFYMDSLRKMARKNQGRICSAHLRPLYSSIDSLVNQKSEEANFIRDENAKMALLTQAMEVSEALLYFKNKHTK